METREDLHGGMNIGELSEFYAALKIAGDGVLWGGDEKLRLCRDRCLHVVKVLRSDFSATVGDMVVFTAVEDKHSFPKEVVLKHSQRLLDYLYLKTKNKHLPVPSEILSFMTTIGCKKAAASSTRKRDITLDVCDEHIGSKIEYGFSMKSYIGGDPSLLNASPATNICYRIKGLSKKNVEDFEKISKENSKHWIIDRLALLKKVATEINFDSYDNATFAGNLLLIDDALPWLVAEALRAYYFGEAPDSSCKSVLRVIAKENHLGYPDSQRYYAVKFKHFLRVVALGMMPSEPWNDSDDATGGYIVVRPDGKIVAFYVYNRKLFDEYLLNCTRFERPSTSRHHYMNLIPTENKNEYLLKLNLQIRFKKPCGI